MPSGYRRAERLVRATIDRNRMLGPEDTVAVGVSGGADSLCLLHLLCELNRRGNRNRNIRPVHVHAGRSGTDPSRVTGLCRRLGLDCTVRAARSPGSDARESACYLCARERRRILFRAAEELGADRVALGHHLEDVNETFLMNLLYTSSGATLLPVQGLFGGRLRIIRPLYYLDKNLIRSVLRHARVRPLRNSCPESRAGTRLVLRRFLARLAKRYPRAPANLFWGIHNLKPEYLPRRAR
jgi:tRNA 2-thiocytidine biosynthesis protein TtcA